MTLRRPTMHSLAPVVLAAVKGKDANADGSFFAPITDILASIWHVLLKAAPGLMGIAILIVAVMWITAGSNETKAAKAKKQAIRVAVGIFMFGAYLIFKSFVLDLGSFMGHGFGDGG